MSIITLEFDNTLEKSNIIMPLMSSSKSEAGDDYVDSNLTDKMQTSVFGIQVPLIMINSTVVNFDAVQYFNLKSIGILPELVMTVEDNYEIISNIDKPSNDNEVRIQILPRFDNAYKKIDLTFYITDIQVNGKLVRLTCVYKSPLLLSSQYKSFGEIDTYTMFKQIAGDTKLGFATNIAPLSDNRFMYCDNKSLLDLMNDEISYANASEHIMDWWIDLWDNINLVDIKERYNTIDSNDDLQIWIAPQINDVTVDNNPTPQLTIATLMDHPAFSMSELFVKSYTINNKPGMQISKGSDRVYGIYEDNNNEYMDYLIQDGDIKNDIFTKYDYIGENYGEYNYMLAKQLRESFIQKINNETINVTLQSPTLALMRGHKVNYVRYVNNGIVESKIKSLEDAGFVDRNVETNIPLTDYEITTESDNGKFVIDKSVSGQYLIIGTNIIYSNNAWDYVLTLSKPASSKTNILVEK
jgi:hypothetical protein